jgi:hypothetical protein
MCSRPGVGEHLSGHRRAGQLVKFGKRGQVAHQWLLTVAELRGQRARLHLLEARARARSRPARPGPVGGARNSAVEPVEQLLFTLLIGMPVRPSS